MSSEQLAGALVLAVVGLGTFAVGALGRHGALDYALGGWTRDTATTHSWQAAHRAIGSWFMVGGALAAAGAAAVVVAPADAIGPVVVLGTLGLLAAVVVGVVVGTNRIEAR